MKKYAHEGLEQTVTLTFEWNPRNRENIDAEAADRLEEEALARALELMMDGYTGGDLLDSTEEYYGWWSVKRAAKTY